MLIQTTHSNTKNIIFHKKQILNQNKACIHTPNLTKDSTHFKGLNTVLQKGIKTEVKRVPELKKVFGDLFEAVENNNNITKTEHYKTMTQMIKDEGFFRTLVNLCAQDPQNEIKTLVTLAEEKPLILAKQNEKPVFILDFAQTYKLSDNYENRVNAKKQMVISFRNEDQTKEISFCLDKNSNFILDQTDTDFSRRTNFRYNGNREKVVEQLTGGNQCRTFYNENGSESFWKNLFFGGPTIPTY